MTQQSQHTSGIWMAISSDIYEVDDLGNPGNLLATARDSKLAAQMADAHNSMLAALKDAKEWLGTDLFTSGDLYQWRCAKSIQLMRAAIAKAEGTKP